MTERKLRVIILTHGGAELVLEDLCALRSIDVVGVFVESQRPPGRSFGEKLKRSIRYDGYIATGRKFLSNATRRNRSTDGMNHLNSQDKLKMICESHEVPYYLLRDYHAPDSVALLKSSDADLAVVFGTNILRESVFSIPRLGSINFHSGFVPFYRGGPPVFWELFNDEKLVGLTVHWMARKVDTGDVIVQDTAPLNYDFSFDLNFDEFISHYRSQLGQRAANLVAQAVDLIARNAAPRVPQDPELGTRYRLPTKKQKDELRRRLKKRRLEQRN